MKILSPWPWPQGHPQGGDDADKNLRPIFTIMPNMNEIHQRVFKIWGLINFNAKTLTLWRKDERTNVRMNEWKSENYIPPHTSYVGGIMKTISKKTTAIKAMGGIMKMIKSRINTICLNFKWNVSPIHTIRLTFQDIQTLFSNRNVRIFLYFSKKTCCDSSEAPYGGTSNEYLQYMFSWRNKKTIYMDTLLILLICSYVMSHGISIKPSFQNEMSFMINIRYLTCWHVHLERIQISLLICLVWSESSLDTF